MKNYLKLFFVFVLVLIATGCGSKKLTNNSSVEDLLDIYMEGFKNGDQEKILSTFPDFTHDYYAKYISEETIKQTIEYYGDNIETSYKITNKNKLSQEELDNLNESIKTEFKDYKYILPSECYSLEGTTSISGSEHKNETEINEVWYCNFDGTWRLLEG